MFVCVFRVQAGTNKSTCERAKNSCDLMKNFFFFFSRSGVDYCYLKILVLFLGNKGGIIKKKFSLKKEDECENWVVHLLRTN